jgi:hypothetical protein
MVDVFRWVNVSFSAILAGGMVLELLILIPAARLLPTDRVLTAFRFSARRSGYFYAPPNGIVALIAAIVVVIAGHDFDHASTVLRLIGAAVLVSGAFATASLYMHGLYKPTKKVASLSDSHAAQLLSRWHRAQLVRTTLYVGSLALFIAADVAY